MDPGLLHPNLPSVKAFGEVEPFLFGSLPTPGNVHSGFRPIGFDSAVVSSGAGVPAALRDFTEGQPPARGDTWSPPLGSHQRRRGRVPGVDSGTKR